MDSPSNCNRKENMERIELTPWFYYDRCKYWSKCNNRIIYIPSPALKKVQRLILRKYFKEHWVFNSVKDAASVHCGKKWLMKLDVLDFYNSISEEQIKDVIRYCVASYKNPNQIRSREVSDVEQIFSICTINGKLPTGAPTSPYIANLLMREFDMHMEAFCRKSDVYYSRYMDDLFFSTNGPQYLLSFVELEVLKQFKELDFKINVDKIKYISSNKKQQVLGLCVNNTKPVLTKEDKRKYRAYFYNLLFPLQYNKKKNYEKREKEILGHLAYINSIDEEYYFRICHYILKLLQKWKLLNKPCLKKLIKTNHFI